MMSTTSHVPTKARVADEIANSITHGLGLLLSLIGLPILITATLERGDAMNVIGASVFGASLVALYAASTLYHAIAAERPKRVLQIVDHVAIFLLIAGTYTPFTLGVLRGAWGWSLFGVVWSLAGAGIVFKLLFGAKYQKISTFFYVAMGWLIVVAARPLMTNLPTAGVLLLAAGGLLYTGGVGFYLTDHRRFRHAVWHLFVMGGSACHFLAVLQYA